MLITMKNNVGARIFSALHCRVMKQTPDFCLKISRNICLSISGE